VEAKVGDRVSIDAKKVGQPRRAGVIRSVAKGLSGSRYQVRWDDGQESVIAPGAGNLVIEGRANGKAKSRRASANKKGTPKRKASKRKR
jgi:hypothetical protein